MIRRYQYKKHRYDPPIPHVLEHALHDPQDDTAQSLGQQLCVHERVCCLAGHAGLQYGWVATVRVWYWVPAPHLPLFGEHALHEPHAFI